MESENDEIDKIIEDIYSNYNNNRVLEAFKIFNKGNINLQLKVLIIKECQEILKNLGYNDYEDEKLIFKGDVKKLKYATYLLTKKINIINEKIEKQAKEEEEKKQEEIRKEFEEKSKILMEQKMERERLRQQCLNDRKEVSQNMKPKNSVATNLKYGAKEVKVEFQCSGGGGR